MEERDDEEFNKLVKSLEEGYISERYINFNEHFEQLQKQNEEIKNRIDTIQNENSSVLLQIIFSVMFVVSLCLIIFAFADRNIIFIITGIITTLGSLYGLFYNEM